MYDLMHIYMHNEQQHVHAVTAQNNYSTYFVNGSMDWLHISDFHLMQTGPKDEVHSTKARENGLCVSLLERIHTIYSNLDDSTCLKKEYMASLLTNYRCHEGTVCL